MSRIESICEHISGDCIDILNFTRGISEEEFLNNKMMMKAVCMSLINIGELVKSLPESFCLEHSSMPWRRIAGMRDLAAHKYKTLNMAAVWVVVKENIPELLAFVDHQFPHE